MAEGRLGRLLERRRTRRLMETTEPVALPQLAQQWGVLSSHGKETLLGLLTQYATPDNGASQDATSARVRRVVDCLNGIQPPYYPLPHTWQYQETTHAASRAIEHTAISLALGGTKDQNTARLVADLSEISVALRESKPQTRTSRP